DRRDRDLVLRARHAWSGIDACAARRLDKRRADVREDPVVASRLAVLEYLARPTLDEAPDVLRHALPALERLRKHARVHVHVFLLARGAGAGVCDVDAHLAGQL